MEDKYIIQLYLSRNEKALEETEIKYGKYLLKIAENILGNKTDSEECLNDTLNAAWTNLNIRSVNNLKMFLVRIIKNKAINKANSEKRVKRGGGQYIEAIDEINDAAGIEDGPEEAYMKKLTKQVIHDFLDSLPDIERKIFVRRYWFYEPSSDIAKLYDMSEASVNMKLHRIRKKFKKHMEKAME